MPRRLACALPALLWLGGCSCAGGETRPGDGDGFPAAEDCDDTDPDVNPDASEICNGVDDDCSGRADEPFDDDRDGYTTGGGGDVAERDCNDRDPAVHPGAPERCNGADDDCDGVPDEDDGEIDLCPGGGFCLDGVCSYECAPDSPDDGCDTYHVRVQFLENPGNQFIMDLLRDDPTNAGVLCAEPQLCA